MASVRRTPPRATLCDTRPRPPRSDIAVNNSSAARQLSVSTRHYGFAGELRQRRRQQQQLGGREGERARGHAGFAFAVLDDVVIVAVVAIAAASGRLERVEIASHFTRQSQHWASRTLSHAVIYVALVILRYRDRSSLSWPFAESPRVILRN